MRKLKCASGHLKNSKFGWIEEMTPAIVFGDNWFWLSIKAHLQCSMYANHATVNAE